MEKLFLINTALAAENRISVGFAGTGQFNSLVAAMKAVRLVEASHGSGLFAVCAAT